MHRPPTPPESELSLLTSVLEHRRLNRRTSLDLLDERSKHKFRMEVIEMARKELKARRGKLEGLKKRFGGVVKVSFLPCCLRGRGLTSTCVCDRRMFRAPQPTLEKRRSNTQPSSRTQPNSRSSNPSNRRSRRRNRRGREWHDQVSLSFFLLAAWMSGTDWCGADEKFLGFLERLADDPRFPTPESAISHFLNLLDTQAVLSERFAESEERRGAAEEAIVSLASEHDEKPDEAAMLRAEIEGTKSETAKLESEVAGLLEKHGPLMSKITDSKTRITALSTALEQRTSLLLGTGPSTATSPLEQLDSILGRVRELDELMEKMRQGQQRRQSRPATAKSRAQSAGRKSRPIG